MRNAESDRAGCPARVRSSTRARSGGRFRPRLLELEGRRLPSSTFTVTSTADSGSGTLRAAVLAADSAGGSSTIQFDSTVFGTPQTILLSQGELVLTSGTITVNGPGAGLLTIDGGRTDRIFQVFSGMTAIISGLTIRDGAVARGGGLYVQGNATLANCTISGSTAANGGALYSTGTLTLTGCTLAGNSAKYGGGLWNGGTATLTGCTLAGNSAYMGGGVLNNKYSHANLTDCTISGNSAQLGGGLSNYGRASLTACTVSGNTATNNPQFSAHNPGGGIYNYSNYYGGKTTLVDTIVAGNSGTGGAAGDIGGDNSISVTGTHSLIGTGGNGGIINGLSGDIVLTSLASLGLAPLGDYGGPSPTMPLLSGSSAIGKGTSVSGVTTDQRGFALDTPIDIGAFQAVTFPLVVGSWTDGAGAPSGSMDLRGAVNLANLWSAAAAITFAPTIFVSARTIALTAGALMLTETGGAIAISGPSAGVTVSGGGSSRVFQVGAGVTATISGLTLSGGAAATGSGLYNLGATTLTDCTITGNSATGNGGGLANRGVLSLVECTVSGNTAGGGGGGLYNNSRASLTACTVSGNTAGGAGGGGLYEGTLASDGTTLGDTIVAGNSGSGGSSSDVGGRDAGNVNGTYNLIGTGGSGGIVGGASGNMVLTSLAGLALAPMGEYGGPMPTFALLPGCPAIDAGSNGLIPVGISTDQRGLPRIVNGTVDIGAVESQGFTLTAAVGSTPQSTPAGAPFPDPLAVTVAANNRAEPVVGGVVRFVVNPAGGAGASLSASTATIGAAGQVQVTATADLVAGSYSVTATAAGASSTNFSLTNEAGNLLSGLTAQTIVYGTAAVTFSGIIGSGSAAPVGESVAVTLNGVTQQATIGATGSFSTTFNTASLSVAGSPYTVQYVYSGDGTFPAASGTSTLTVTRATATVSISDAGGTYSGSPFAATANVAGVSGVAGSSLEGVGLSLTYFAGSTATGTPLAGAPSAAGTYTVQASFPGGSDYAPQSAQVTFIITAATPTITWNTPASIVYGTALGSSQLDATANVPGTFTYTPAAGTVLGAGTRTLSASFAPTDSADYTSAGATTTIVVAQATPTVTWANPAGIVYGTALSSAQLDATASVPGTFTYTPAAGTVLGAGNNQTLSVSFAPTDSTNYKGATATATIVVAQATPTITWANPASIVYGTALSSAQLNATASVPGSFSYTPAAGTVLGAGTRTLSASFAPTDSADYTSAGGMTTIVVAQATPTVTWANPAGIVYGTALSSAQLDATANVPGTFTYTPAAGIILGAGSQTLSATFTPTDSVDYAAAVATTTIVIAKANPTVQVTGGGVYTGAPIPATARVAGVVAGVDTTPAPSLEGVSPALAYFTGATATGAPLVGPPSAIGTYTVVASFPGSADYTSAAAQATFSITSGVVALTWNAPAPIAYGTALGPAQLDATANVPGTFSYSPAAGTILGAGAHTLSVLFTPTDSADYPTATATVSITVTQATPSVTWAAPASIVHGSALGAGQLDATANVAGSFTYNPAAGTVLGAGTWTLAVTFAPTDSADYTSASATTTIVVSRATPTITWAAPASIVYGTALGSSQLDATANVPGTFTYTPAAGTALGAGTQALSASFAPTDATDYTSAGATTTIVVSRATPTITWADPVSIVYGTALSSAQLDATANVPGSFSYTPAAGTVLGAGTQALSASFAPTDSVDYATTTATTSIQLTRAVPAVIVSDAGGPYTGSPHPATAVVIGVNGVSGPTLEGVSPVFTYYSGPKASGPPLPGPPSAIGRYTVVGTFPGSADYTSAISQPVTFRITQSSTTAAVTASVATAVYGQAVTLTATVSPDRPNVSAPSGTVAILDGIDTLAVVPLDESGQAVLSVNGLATGQHTFSAIYAGDANLAGSQSGVVSESVGPAGTRIVLVPRAMFKGKRVVAVSLTAEVEPLAPGGGVPTGMVTFLVKKKRLGTSALVGGEATLAFKPGKVLNKSITVTYGGADAFTSAGLAAPRLTSRSLAHLTAPAPQIHLSRPMARKIPAKASPVGPGR